MSVITPAPVPASNDNFYKEIENMDTIKFSNEF